MNEKLSNGAKNSLDTFLRLRPSVQIAILLLFGGSILGLPTAINWISVLPNLKEAVKAEVDAHESTTHSKIEELVRSDSIQEEALQDIGLQISYITCRLEGTIAPEVCSRIREQVLGEIRRRRR